MAKFFLNKKLKFLELCGLDMSDTPKDCPIYRSYDNHIGRDLHNDFKVERYKIYNEFKIGKKLLLEYHVRAMLREYFINDIHGIICEYINFKFIKF